MRPVPVCSVVCSVVFAVASGVAIHGENWPHWRGPFLNVAHAGEDYCLSSPAMSEGQIFMRTTAHLWAIGERRKS